MAATGILNGTEYLLIVDGRYVIFSTNASLTITQNLRDISVRETDRWAKSIPGMREWTMEFEGLMGWLYNDGTLTSKHSLVSAQQTQKILRDGYFNQQPMYGLLINIELNAIYWQGMIYLNGISIDTPMEDNSTISLSFSGLDRLYQGSIN